MQLMIETYHSELYYCNLKLNFLKMALSFSNIIIDLSFRPNRNWFWTLMEKYFYARRNIFLR